ncbi:endonuclease/exonuclease/phosphatase family protein [Microbacterium allomyrinae]|jgi:predicted extracellular nuclease|uniref:Endonuclease/exonuclease/phosphatase family protein n=1 Tax=Microbacterium allomyrinae TaxID=2830666 RepID=A0A9X1LYW2_9MICO|nr:endonuclease/exonuclease/phosphatase family protein [Microbacterium allomyrinae]MCC2033740.1 endonuclease/exonuclease/phosphatase family protein [Microbacterium allomyrinae]
MDLDRFSVATFNLYNLQLPGRRMNPGQVVWTDDEYRRKVRWIGAKLRALKPDVVGLQELWHRDAMAEVLADANLDDDYELIAEPASGGRIICAALVRTGLRAGDPVWIDQFPPGLRLESTTPMDPQAPGIRVSIPRFSRPVLRVPLALRDDHVTEVYVAHFKSKLPIRIDTETWFDQDPDRYKPHVTAIGAALATIQRTAEAAALRVLLTETMKGTVTPVIVLGDINDGQHSNTVNILTEQPRYLVGVAQGGADVGLYTAQTLQEYRDTRDVYYTHVHQDLRESLDHVLVSEQFYDHSRRRLWLFDGLSIDNDHLNAEDHRESGTGDHGVVRVSFRWRPSPQDG